MSPTEPIPALLPRGRGHQFVVYADACSGIPGQPHEQTFASVNAVIRRLIPCPDFILFPGDEIAGLTADPDELRAQWHYWHHHEMAWLDRHRTPIWPTTGNHTTYNPTSEAIFREVHAHLPRNGPQGQDGLSYWLRRDDLLLVFVHTLWSGLGGEGHVETDWLRAILHQHADAQHKLVLGHHPVHPVNGFAGAYQRDIGPEHAEEFWNILVQADVLAYVCSHILAFDAQVHRGVLQICTAGAGTAHRMPEGVEYLHCVQAAIDTQGLRYQVLDTDGRIRERLSWPLAAPPDIQWQNLPSGETNAPITGGASTDRIVALRFTGQTAPAGTAAPQTLMSAFHPGILAPLWIGLTGPKQCLTVTMAPEARRSPHTWIGPAPAADAPFDLHLLIHTGMGPGGILARHHDQTQWSSLTAASSWGAERITWPGRWSLGHAQAGLHDRPFQGTGLAASVSSWS
jgi:Calcineurin-like phosphoesterase